MTMRISKDRVDLDDKVLQKPVLKDYGEVVVGGASGTNTSSSYTVDLVSGNVFNLILNANCTFTFSNPPASGVAGNFTLILTQDSTGNRTVTWPGAVTWISGSAPTLTTTAYGVDILTFLTINAGTTWFGAASGQFDAATVPSEPRQLVATATFTKIDLSWLIPSNDGGLAITGYKIYRDTTTNPTTLIDTVGVTYTYDDPGLTAGTEYFYRVKAINAVGDSDYSTEDSTTPIAYPPYTYPAYISYGYFGGGTIPGKVTTVDRIDYASDTSTAVAKGPLSLARSGLAATGNLGYGYFGGGSLPGSASTVDRIDYANDTSTAVVRGPLSVARSNLGAVGNSSFGYFGGGLALGTVSTIDRVDYASDTSTAVEKGPLSSTRQGLAAIGHSSYGYFGGGAPTPRSTVDRIDYASDTGTAAVKGPLALARFELKAAGNSSYGYFAGGYAGPTPGARSYVDRIDYSSDTSTALTRGPLSFVRYDLTATTNSSFGYFGGGTNPPAYYTTVDRIDYSSDTSTAIAKGPLSLAREDFGSTNHNPI